MVKDAICLLQLIVNIYNILRLPAYDAGELSRSRKTGWELEMPLKNNTIDLIQ